MHTHLTTPDRRQNVWSYLQVKENAEADRAMHSEQSLNLVLSEHEVVYLEQNTVVEWRENSLIINGNVIPHHTRNVFISEEGRVELNRFIRTFD